MEPIDARPRHSPSLAVYRRIAFTFIALTCAVVALVAYVVLLRAEIVVLSEQEEIRGDMTVEVAEGDGGDVSGTVTSVEETVSRTFPSASVVKVKMPSKGEVRIKSALSRSQTLIASTRLEMADGTLYRLKNAVTVPAFGAVTVETYADDASKPIPTESEISFTIPGLNADTRALFTVTSVGSFAGEEKDVKMVTAGDMNAATETLKAELMGTLKTQVEEKANASGAVMGGEIVSYDVVKRTSDVEVGSDADEYTLTVTVRATAIHYDAERFATLVREGLQDKLSYDKTLRAVEESGTTIEVEKIDVPAGRATLKVSASGTSILSADAPSLSKEKLLGVTIDAAKEYLEGIDGVASASVRTKPFWSSRVPNVPDHVTVEVR